ncbi:MAG TPA: nitrite reductase small subunit NirD [Thermoleophilia bacterium]|nr:nitrite reductase small subunit NirD [Thermoleophilia bacterium]
MTAKQRGWTSVCRYADLAPGHGVAALVDGVQIAVFRTATGELYAIGNRDPYSGEYLISDGVTGSRDGVPTVASPMYEHVFDLRSGTCLDDPTLALPTYPVRRYRGQVWVQR